MKLIQYQLMNQVQILLLDSKFFTFNFSNNGINITKIDNWKEISNFGSGKNLNTKFCPISLKSQTIGSVVASSIEFYDSSSLVNQIVRIFKN